MNQIFQKSSKTTRNRSVNRLPRKEIVPQYLRNNASWFNPTSEILSGKYAEDFETVSSGEDADSDDQTEVKAQYLYVSD